MTGTVLELSNIISPDMKATRITERWIQWDTLRNVKKTDWEEVRRYVYATDTTQTTNNQLPWKNKTTVPKLCQIRDNLYANYSITTFPKRKSIIWEANEQDAASVAKRDAITNYMSWVISQPSFKHEIDKVILDYIDFGNCFVTVEWTDQRTETEDGRTTAGFIGPSVKRISPLDIVMNPTAESFVRSPKLIRSILSMGEVKKLLERLSTDQNQEEYKALYDYLKNIRFQARTFQGDWIQRDHLYAMDGFTSFRAYLLSEMVELITFYGDFYDPVNDCFEENKVVTVIDRHKLINDKPNPSFFGHPPIYHAAWRKKQDNLWGMGPLDNLIGMQYRMDHIENMGADVWDLVTYPVQKVKGFVEDFVWQPGEKIFTSEEGDVELVVPDVNVMQSDMKIERLENMMEQMAGAPKEAMGFRTPGEKTKYEVQRLENAASRIFQNKIKQFEEQILEPLLNAMLELARRNLTEAVTIKVLDDEFKTASFQSITVEDITGVGRIKPIAARHFAEQAELIQNLTNLTGSGLWPVVQPHFSGIKLAKILEDTFDLTEHAVVMPFVALSEQAEGQKMVHALQEQLHQSAGTATGLNNDYDLSAAQSAGMGGGGGGEPPPAATPPKTESPFDLKRQPPEGAVPQGLLGTQ